MNHKKYKHIEVDAYNLVQAMEEIENQGLAVRHVIKNYDVKRTYEFLVELDQTLFNGSHRFFEELDRHRYMG